MTREEIAEAMMRTGFFGDDEAVPQPAWLWIDTFIEAYRDHGVRTPEEALREIAALRAESVIVPALELERLRSRQAIFYLDAVGQYVDDQPELRGLPLSHDLLEIAKEFGLTPDDALWAVRMALTGQSEGLVGVALPALRATITHPHAHRRNFFTFAARARIKSLSKYRLAGGGEPFTPLRAKKVDDGNRE